MFAQIKNPKLVSAIIPIFDEEKNIAKIIKFLLGRKIINEVVCVNDGSTDKSLKILEKFKKDIKIVSYKKNRGKGYALSQGIKKSSGEILLFLDADLINLKQKHIKDLVAPLLTSRKKAVLGYGTRSKNHFWDSSQFVINVTGQRTYFKKDLICHLNNMSKARYGVEIYLNSVFKKKEVELVPLVGLTHIWKHKKHKTQKAIKQYIVMGSEMAQEIGRRELREHPTLGKITKIKNLKEPSFIYVPVNRKLQQYYKILKHSMLSDL